MEDLPDEVREALEKRRHKPDSDNSLLALLESKYVMSMILYIDKMSPVLKTDLYHTLSRGSGMQNKIDSLHELGIIEIYRTARTNTNVIVITDKGRKVAEVIRKMLEVAEGE